MHINFLFLQPLDAHAFIKFLDFQLLNTQRFFIAYSYNYTQVNYLISFQNLFYLSLTDNEDMYNAH